MENQTPQLEQGYTKIANKILEKLAMYRISGEEWLILLTILRKTYGYNKKEDFISISQFYEATGLAKPSICRAINKLLQKNVINKKAKGEIGLYSFNKLYATWKPFTKKLMINNIANTINKKVNVINKKANPHLQKSDIQKKKETITKETITKEIPEHHLDYLLKIPEEHILKYTEELGVTKEQVIDKAKELHNYCIYRHKSYSNYKLFLWNALKRDFKGSNKYRVGVAKI